MQLVTALAILVIVPFYAEALSMEKEFALMRQEMLRFRAEVSDIQAQMDTVMNVVDLDVRLNNTEELEARVTVLEESVSDLETSMTEVVDEVDDLESITTLQEQRLNILDIEVNDNINDIEELDDLTSAMQNTVLALDLRVSALEAGTGEWTACESSPCDNNASCIDVNVDTFVCACTSGYFGLTCSDSYSDATFLASLSTTQSSGRDPLIFENARINPGGHYSTSTGQYTVPYDGIYQFSVHLTYYSSVISFYIDVDNSPTNSHYDYYNAPYYRGTTVLLELTAGQTVHVDANYGVSGSSSYLYSYFSGHLVNPTY